MNELSPRLNYLRRQAERAKERDQIAQELHELLKQWYGYRWHTATALFEQSQLGEQGLQGSVAERQKALAGIGTRIENLRAEQSTLRQDLGKLHHESSELHTQAETVTRDLAVSQERLRQTQDRQEEAEALQQELSARQQERQQSQNALDAARNHLNQLRGQQADSESRLEQVAERRTAISAEQRNHWSKPKSC